MCVKPHFFKHGQVHHTVKYCDVEIGYIHRHACNEQRFFCVRLRKPRGDYHEFTSVSIREAKDAITILLTEWYGAGEYLVLPIEPEYSMRRILYDPITRAKMLKSARDRLMEQTS